LEPFPGVFASKPPRSVGEFAAKEDRLCRKIGQLEVKLDWLKKKSTELNG